MDSRLQQRNAGNKMVKVAQSEEGGDALQTKKRRAAFGDITNKESLEKDAKKQCVKKAVGQPAKITAVSRPAKAQSAKLVAVKLSKPVQPSAAAELTAQPSSSLISVVASSAVNVIVAPPTVTEEKKDERTLSQGPVPDAEMEDLCARFEWIDVDAENRDSPFYVTDYVNDIFDYYKQREAEFCVSDYMSAQTQQQGSGGAELTLNMRAILVDWLVEVQQNFELNHESLYLAVKLLDLFLARRGARVASPGGAGASPGVAPVPKDKLQLVGATALSIACKFEERSPPVLDDYLYICDDAYSREDLLDMETDILTTLNFDLGAPLSYTFLRRYAQCGRVSIPTLTLARFMLESSLMDYAYVACSESRLAAACLLLAMRMNNEGTWDATMLHYTGYVRADLASLVRQLNAMVTTPLNKTLVTISTKYSHRIFHEVAKIPALKEPELNALLESN